MDIFRTPVRCGSIDDVRRVYLLSDWHLGEVGAHVGFLRKAVRYIAADPKAVVITLGDLGGFIAPDDRRFDPLSVAPELKISDMASWGDTMVELVADVLGPLRGKVACSLEGNHEGVYSLRTHSQVNRAIAHKLGAEPLGYTASIGLDFVDRLGRRAALEIAASHGGSGATTFGGKLQALLRWAEGFGGFDVYAMGHVHTCVDGWMPPRLGVVDGEVVERETPYCLVTGTALRTYVPGHSGYGERKGYRPTHIGFPCLCVVPETKDMWTRWIFERTLREPYRYAGLEAA